MKKQVFFSPLITVFTICTTCCNIKKFNIFAHRMYFIHYECTQNRWLFSYTALITIYVMETRFTVKQELNFYICSSLYLAPCALFEKGKENKYIYIFPSNMNTCMYCLLLSLLIFDGHSIMESWITVNSWSNGYSWIIATAWLWVLPDSWVPTLPQQ